MKDGLFPGGRGEIYRVDVEKLILAGEGVL